VEPQHAVDEPAERDRLAVHFAWEAVLLIVLGAGAALVWSRSTDALSGDPLRGQLVIGAGSVLLSTAFALSLRAAAPNLAAGSIAVGAGALTAYLTDAQRLQLGAAIGITAGAALLVGALMGLAVIGLRAPAWAVGIGVATLLAAAATELTGDGGRALPADPDLTRWAWVLFGGAALLSVAGGAFGAAPRVRAVVGRYRPASDPSWPRGSDAGVVAVGALALSALLAAGAGLVFTLRVHSAGPVGNSSLLTTVAAFAAALVGGTSVHGRRGGIFGTVLAASALQMFLLWLALGGVAEWIRVCVVGGAVLLGLAVSRLIEHLGRPGEPDLEFSDTMPIGQSDYPTRYVDLL
jgi:ribose/xylose/arabinose/galactoside ABC-type transport system permease subunit